MQETSSSRTPKAFKKGIKKLYSKANQIWQGGDAPASALKILAYRFLIIGVNLLTGVITARLLMPEGRGELTAIGVGSGFLPLLLTLGIPPSLIYNVRKSPESRANFLAIAMVMSVLLGLVAAITSTILIPTWLSNLSPEAILFSQWLTLLSPLVLLHFTSFAALEALERFSLINFVILLIHTSSLIGLIGFHLTHHLTALTGAICYAAIPAPLTLWMVITAGRSYQLTGNHLRLASIQVMTAVRQLIRYVTWDIWSDLFTFLSRLIQFNNPIRVISEILEKRLKSSTTSPKQIQQQDFQSLIGYGFRAYGIDLLSILAQQADQVLVVGLLSSKMIGMYVVAVNLARTLNIFQTSIVMVLFPKIAAKSLGEVMHVTGQSARITSLAMALSSIALSIVGPWLLTILYGPRFHEASAVLRVLVLEAVVSSTTLVLAQAFMALGKPGIVTLLQAIGLGLSVPLMVLLVPRFGLVGAGIALLISAIVRLGFILSCFPSVLKTPPPNLLITAADFKYVYNKLWRRTN